MKIEIESNIRKVAPELRIIRIEADVTNCDTPDALRNQIETTSERIASSFELSWINKRSGIAATRDVYKLLGKEPNRYRPSAEALCRRIVQGKGLYYVNMLVDLINLVSISTGYSIGGFDADKIEGDTLRLGVGKMSEDFNAIGRGQLNIEFLPVYRDAIGGIGTPTSDCERTKLTAETRRLLMLVNVYGEEIPIEETISLTRDLLERYARLKDFKATVIEP